MSRKRLRLLRERCIIPRRTERFRFPSSEEAEASFAEEAEADMVSAAAEAAVEVDLEDSEGRIR
ncbi:MAG TPA: hypothetical protein PK364_07645 [Synergistaceae bacterium]|nr:hypothetical protein [Synergistaceae bacterium]HPQ37187.1 hypothetical protein [Synergistaceae bacterium]